MSVRKAGRSLARLSRPLWHTIGGWSIERWPHDSVWIEELTWMEVRDNLKAGKTIGLVVAGSTEQNGPYVATGKHVYVLRATADAIARKQEGARDPAVSYEMRSGSISLSTTLPPTMLR